MISIWFSKLFSVRCREKGLGIAGPHVYHWLLRSYLSRESMAVVRFDCVEWLQLWAYNLLKFVQSLSLYERLHKEKEREKRESQSEMIYR